MAETAENGEQRALGGPGQAATLERANMQGAAQKPAWDEVFYV
jgi:hypothetical protein